ncbi:glycosyltransferase family 2 protein [Rufibacter latericius]|uniref:Glycosyltransferase family 2 protein n=1 Tax=Rufibacter latericius TaxID=2487040 RepID=A0A3M9MGA2_9BACT|nr:glycosyltransferase family A protein [Rufibacter latericius]RNI24546.1 glycosyltransferase family 2 protein [Rufibacter latericius]
MSTVSSPLVSVIIAFLNEERFLTEAIESVLRQEYDHWELLLVDDGSTDKSTRLAKDFAARFPGKVFYYEHSGHQNKGLSASRNYGLSKAKGQYVAILDADDVWLPGKLANQVAIFKQHPEVAMIAEASEYWYSWEDDGKENVSIAVGAPQDKTYDPPALLEHLYPLGKGAAPVPSGLILETEAFRRLGGFEDSFRKEYGLYEDQAFLSKMYLKEKVYVSSACNNRYRQRPESIVSSVHADGKYHAVRKFFLHWLQEYLQKEQIQDKTTRSLLQKALFPYEFPRLYFLSHKLLRKLKRF